MSLWQGPMIGLGSNKYVDLVDFQSTLPDFDGCQIIAKGSDKLDWQMKDIKKAISKSHFGNPCTSWENLKVEVVYYWTKLKKDLFMISIFIMNKSRNDESCP